MRINISVAFLDRLVLPFFLEIFLNIKLSDVAVVLEFAGENFGEEDDHLSEPNDVHEPEKH